MASAIRYEIVAGENAPSELWSEVDTNFGGPARNFICEGTYTYCEQTIKVLQELDELKNLVK